MHDNPPMTLRTLRPVCALLTLLTMAVAATAAAATQDTLAEVVVTATRRAESRLDFAGSISSLDAEAVALLGPTHAAEALNRAAGVYLQRGSGQEMLTAIRSPVLAGAGACGAFLILEDSMPIRPVGVCNVNELFELNTARAERIEIVRGPATAAFGANAVHGIVNVITPAVAALDTFSIGATLGSDSLRRVDMETRIGTVGAYGQWSRDPGYRTDSGGDEAKINLLYDGGIGEARLRVRAAGTVLNQETAGFVRGLDAYRDPLLRRSNPNPEAFRDAWSGRISAEAAWNGCDGCITEARLLLRRSQMDFLQHFLLGKPLERNGQHSVAASVSRLQPLGDRLELRAGVDLDVSRSELLEVQSGPTTEGSAVARAIRPAGRHYDYEVDGRTAGAYAQLRWAFRPGWRVGTALRLERTEYGYDNRMLAGNTSESGVPCAFGGCLFSRPADRDDSFDNASPRIELDYAPTDGQRVYVSAGRGFRPPESTELYRLQRQQSIATLGSERLDSTEIGWNGQRERLAWSLAAFAMTKNGLILRDSNAFNVSGGRTTHRGVEYELSFQPAPGWSAAVAGTWALHRYAFDALIDGGERIVAGLDVDTAPRTLNNFRLGWSPNPRFGAQLEVVQVGSYFVDASNTRSYPGHWLAHLRVTGQLGPGWRVTLRLDNLTDRAYADRADFAQGDYRYFPGAGRRAQLQIEYSVADR